jgi:phosphate starvation-inducible protein PhoH and related proteins
MVTKRMALQDQEEAVLLFGQHDRNLKELEHRFGVQIFVRPGGTEMGGALTLAVRGRPGSVEQAISTLREMKRTAVRVGRHAPLVEVPPMHPHGQKPFSSDAIYVTITGRSIRPQTPQQKAYVQAIQDHDMVFGIGPAGTGKTYLAVACALAAYQAGKTSRIILTRPVVEAGEKLGFLPGDFYEKIHPYLKPLYDAFYGMMGPDRFRVLREEETIEIIPLAYMRGRSLDDAFIILDEGQNTTPEQMKMFLTRMGHGSRIVVTGDVTQVDLEKKITSGLIQVADILKGVQGISFVRFTEEDVVRHGLVRKVIRAYEDWEKKEK